MAYPSRSSSDTLRDLERMAAEPVPPLVGGAPMIFDRAGRLWVATTRDHEAASYLDVFDPPEYLGSVRVRDRLLGFDIVGTTLVTLVERERPGPSGLRPRARDWYRLDPSW